MTDRDYRRRRRRYFLHELLYRVKDGEVTAVGAQLTYYLILSIFPFLIFFLNLLSYTSIARDEVLDTFIIMLPIEVQILIKNVVSEIVGTSSDTLLSLGIILTLWTGSLGISAIIKAVNKAYDVENKRPYWKIKGLAIFFTIALAFVLILVLSMLVFGEIIGKRLFARFGAIYVFSRIWQLLRLIIPFVSMVVIFALLYKLSPAPEDGTTIRFRHILPGALFTSVGWIIASMVFSYYVNNFGKYANTYGSLGGIIVLLVWLYITSIMIILGGEINGTYAYMKQNKDIEN